MSITDLHKKTGISRNSLTLLANGKSRGIQYDTLDKITTALNVNISELFEIEFDKLIIKFQDKKKISLHIRNCQEDIPKKELGY